VPSDGGLSIGWIYKYYGYESRVKQILADSTDLTAPDFDTKFESIFIDGAHDSESVVADTKLALELLSEGGVLIWHDFTLLAGELENYSSTKGVFRAISECLKLLEQNEIKLYWIKESWLLVGKKG
jgi:predicted O-methyltransferase YrrM